MEVMKQPPGTSSTPLLTSAVTDDTSTDIVPLTEEELVRIEFYKTYDVMTGIRIAATLGGFFSMMILLVLYKSYCKPGKSLSEEQLNRAVSAAVEEEDRALAAAIEATSFYSSLGKARQSIGSGSQPRYSSPALGAGTQYSLEKDDPEDMPDDEIAFEETVEESAPDYYACSYLSVPVDRRASSITCSSGDTSYLERRGSAFEMGLPPLPSYPRETKTLPTGNEQWDFYYPIDIQVVQPTPPDMSPSTSERTIYEEPRKLEMRVHSLQVPPIQDRMHRLTVDRSEMGLAPLASISSLGSFSSQSSPWLSAMRRERRELKEDHHEDSVGSDNVFADELDTEDEVEEFETDSELENGFDDDYSFCEATARPVSRCERQPRFASFDSCDISLNEEEGRVSVHRSPRHLGRQQSMQDGVRLKKKLTKTYSEPRHTKQLPQWVERGRSSYVPRRQLSAPATRPKDRPSAASPQPPHIDRPHTSMPHSGSDSDTLTLHDECLSQGNRKDLPNNEKRGRFVKQRTIHEGASNLLVSPSPVASGSCGHLDELPEFSVVVNIAEASRSSSQETLC